MTLRILFVSWMSLSIMSHIIVLAQRYDGKSNWKDSMLYEVSLLNKYHRHYCGGAIIRLDWVITAGRCSLVCGQDLNCAVRYGSKDINSGKFAPIRIFAVHPTTNIAIVEAPLIIQGNIKPLMIFTYPLPSKAALMAVGWRWDRSPRVCNKYLKKATFHQVDCFMNDSICAMPRDNKLCFGDYGGPLVFRNQLVGISNFGSIGIMENENEDNTTTHYIDYIANFILRFFNDTLRSSIFLENLKTTNGTNEVEKDNTHQIAGRRVNLRCSTGYGTFVHVARFVSWIDETIRQYIEEYDLDNLPRPNEWTEDYVKQTYVFEGTSNQC